MLVTFLTVTCGWGGSEVHTVKLIKTLRFKNLARTQVTVTAPFIFTR